jgi:hypothetical protein
MSTEEKFKVKIGEEEKDFVVKHPTARIEAEANMYASKVFSKLVKEKNSGNDGLLLRAQLDDYLRGAGLYTDDDIKAMGDMGKEVERLEQLLMKGGLKKSEGRNLAINLRKNRYGLLNLLSKRLEYDKNTIEHHSENARINYIVSKCVCDVDGSPVFRSVEDYEFDDTGLKDKLYDLISRVGSLCSSYDPDYESKLVENKFLKKFGYCDDKFNLTNTEGQLVNEKGERVDDNGNLLDENGNPIIVVKEIGEFLED